MTEKERYIFIDRDGVINNDGENITDHGYILKWEDFEFLPGVLEAFRKLKASGYRSVIISNQKCVAKGLTTMDELSALTERYTLEVEKSGGGVDAVYYCPHTDEDNCSCRKPKEGLFLSAAKDLDIKGFGGKYFIGDSRRDIQAGKKVGLGTILVLSGKSSREDVETWKDKPDHIFQGLLEAVEFVIAQDKNAT